MRQFSILCALTLLAACSPSSPTSSDPEEDVAIAETPATDVPGPRINEVVLLSEQQSSPDGTANPWMELLNQASSSIRLYDYVVTDGTTTWEMPDQELAAGAFAVLAALPAIDGASTAFLPETTSSLAVLRRDNRAAVDSMTLPTLARGESFARFPDGRGQPSLLAPGSATPAAANPDVGLVRKITTSTAFRPRDSTPNAILRYDGYFWILGGWSNFAHDDWRSYADVWRSQDGARWELVNSDPPYIHYCSFIVWNDRMWAIGPDSFSSSDGVDWRQETLQAPIHNRSVIVGNTLFNIHGTTVRSTRDGVSWELLTQSAPWGENRVLEFVVYYRGKLWVMGGASDYGTPSQSLHNDVWSSTDGIQWSAVTTNARWSPRMWSSIAIHDGRMFLLNGTNPQEWPDENGNAADVWFSNDGIAWFELIAERGWQARHASFTIDDGRGTLLLLAGYGHGGTERIHNDVWSLKASIYFSRPTGALHLISSWGKNPDGSGAHPHSFAHDHQIFFLRNRANFRADQRFSVSGAGSRIVVGDGDAQRPVQLEIENLSPANQPLHLYSNSTTIVRGPPPAVLFKDPNATLIVN